MYLFSKLSDSKLFRSAGIYTIANGINSAIPFFLLPILTRYLSPKDYGIISMFSILVYFLKPFIGINSDAAFKRQWFEQKDIDIKSYASNCFIIFISSSIIVSIFFLLLSNQISRITAFPAEYFWVILIYALGNYITNFILVVWQVKNKPIKFSTFKVLLTLINTSLSIWFVVGLNLGWEGRIFAGLISIILFSILATILIIKNDLLQLSINIDYIGRALKYGLPLLPHTLSTIIITLTDRIFITNMVDISTTGIYVIGYKIGSIISILSLSFDSAFGPWIYEKLKNPSEQTKRSIIKFSYWYFVAIILLALFLGFLSPYFLSFYIGSEFKGSSIFVIWISLGYSFNGMYLVVSKYIFYSYKTYILSWISILTAVLNVILNYFFVSAHGGLGAAYATTLTYLIKFLFVWFLAAKVYKMPWNLIPEIKKIESE